MFQIHVVDRTNRSAYQGHLEDYFRIRHQIYVGGRGWRDLDRPDGREIDAFDTIDAIYLLGVAPNREVVAGSRLVPTLKPHLMSDVFPEVAGGQVPRGPDIYEWTRVFVIPRLREPGRPSRAAGIVYCGIVEFCLQRGIHRLSVVCEPYWFERLQRLGWDPSFLGEPVQTKDGPIAGLLLNMTENALARTRQAYGINGSVLWRPSGHGEEPTTGAGSAAKPVGPTAWLRPSGAGHP